MVRRILILIAILLLAGCSRQPDYLHESQEEKDARMQWWRDAKFGLFIHWGLYAIPAGEYNGQTNHAEWIQETADIPVAEYEKFALRFNPTRFDAEEWVKLAKQAGMKYLVITSKHHDGFCLWDSQVSDYDVIDRTPFKRDILKELSAACKKYGIRFCTYHSIMDWHHPDAQGLHYPNYNGGRKDNPNFRRYVESYLKPQLRELIANYGPIGVLWFDGEWIQEWTEEQGRELYNYVRSLQPDIIINNRVGKARQGMAGMNAYQNAAGDFGTPEQTILKGTARMDWESCMTMNDHWGYNKFDKNFKSTETLIHNLVDIVAKGGNYLLNVGPTAEGVLPEESVQRLREIGEWMRINHPAIYATRRFVAFKEEDWLRYTAKPDSGLVYAIALRWPGEELHLKYVQPAEDAKIRLLGYHEPLPWRFDPEDGLWIGLPESWQKPAARAVQYAYVLRIPGKAAEVVQTPEVWSDSTRVENRLLFTDSVAVRLRCSTEDASIHYFLNHEKTPRLYQEPIVLKSSATMTAYAAKPGMVTSLPVSVAFQKVTAFKKLQLAHPPSPRYPGEGVLSLGDRQRGSDNFRDGRWLGFEGDDFDAVVDLGKVRRVEKVNVGCLQNIGSWIWLPEEVSVYGAGENQNFEFLMKIKPSLSEREKGSVREDIVVPFSRRPLRYLRIVAKNRGVCPDWHPGAGGKAWIFVDEVIIE